MTTLKVDDITSEMLEHCERVFHKGPPGVIRMLRNIDSYPGERVAPDDPPDPDAYTELPVHRNDLLEALRDVIKAAIDFHHTPNGWCPHCESNNVRLSSINRYECADCGARWLNKRAPIRV